MDEQTNYLEVINSEIALMQDAAQRGMVYSTRFHCNRVIELYGGLL